MDIVAFEELLQPNESINYVLASWLPIGQLPRKVCALVVFYIPLLLSCSKPAVDKKSRSYVTDLLDISQHVEIYLAGLKHVHNFFWSQTCLRPAQNMSETVLKTGFKAYHVVCVWQRGWCSTYDQ